MKILAIDTSCDETSAAVTNGVRVLSNVVWSQASQHAKFGGVMPSLAARMHKERIEWVVSKAVLSAKCKVQSLGAIAVTAGPGLAIALEVGIAKAKEMANQLNVPLIPINHIEGHLLSPMARSKSRRVEEQESISFPALGLVVSGGHTELVLIKNIGEYEILAQTQDDALGEALDKAARMLGLGYPGGAILEKMAQNGNPKAYPLPLPMSRSADKYSFSYSGLKTALYRLISAKSSVLSTQDVYDLAATFQNRAFQHLERVIINTILSFNTPPFPSPKLGEGTKGRSTHLLVGGGVAANMELRKRLRKMGREFNLRVRFPYSLKLCGDNAAMICVAAALRLQVQGPLTRVQEIDRRPRWRVDEVK